MSYRDLFEWMSDLVADIPLVTPMNPEPPFYDELSTGPEHDARTLLAAYTRASAAVETALPVSVSVSEQIEQYWVDLGVWLSDMARVTATGHDLCYRLGVAAGEIIESREFDEHVTDRIPVVYAAQWASDPADPAAVLTAADALAPGPCADADVAPVPSVTERAAANAATRRRSSQRWPLGVAVATAASVSAIAAAIIALSIAPSGQSASLSKPRELVVCEASAPAPTAAAVTVESMTMDFEPALFGTSDEETDMVIFYDSERDQYMRLMVEYLHPDLDARLTDRVVDLRSVLGLSSTSSGHLQADILP